MVLERFFGYSIGLVGGWQHENSRRLRGKTHLSQLLADVENGETIAITKHGRTVAILMPARDQDMVTAAIYSIRQNRKGITLGKDLSIELMTKEGRK